MLGILLCKPKQGNLGADWSKGHDCGVLKTKVLLDFTDNR